LIYKIPMIMKVNHDGEGLRAAGVAVRQWGGVAPAFWADVDIVPEHREWDAVRAATSGKGFQR
jgi:hypothetical protein